MYWTLIFIFGSSSEGQGKFVDFENAIKIKNAKQKNATQN
jgi:hypothetical protein